MKVHYDRQTDIIFIELAKGRYKVSRKISKAVVVDEDKRGKILGIEILDATKNIEAFNPDIIHFSHK